MSDQDVEHTSAAEGPSGTKDTPRDAYVYVVVIVLAIVVGAVASQFTSNQVACGYFLSTLVSGLITAARAHLTRVGLVTSLVLILISGAVVIISSGAIKKAMPRPAGEAIIVGVVREGTSDRVIGALTNQSQCNPDELVFVMYAPIEKRDYLSSLQCNGKVWAAKGILIGRRESDGSINPEDAKEGYQLRVLRGSKAIVDEALKRGIILPGLTRISGEKDTTIMPNAFAGNNFVLITN